MRSKEAADILNRRLICSEEECNLNCGNCEYFVSDKETKEAWETAIERLNDDEYIHVASEAIVKVANAILKLIDDVIENQEVTGNEKAKNDSHSVCSGGINGNSGTGADD